MTYRSYVPLILLFSFLYWAAGVLVQTDSVWFNEPLLHAGLLIPALFVVLFLLWLLPDRSRDTAVSMIKPVSFVQRIAESAVFSVIAGLLLWYFRMRRFAPAPEGLGDSLLLMEHIPVYSFLTGHLVSFDEILELYIRSKAFLFLNENYQVPVEDAVGFISCIAGMIVIAVVYFVFRPYRLRIRIPATALMIFNVDLQLYAGYVENYSLTAMWITLILFSSSYFLYRKNTGVWPELIGVMAAVSALHHMITVFMLPALVYLCYAKSNGNRRLFFMLSGRASAAAVITLSAGWYIFFFIVEPPVFINDSFAMSPALYPVSRFISTVHMFEIIQVLFFAAPFPLLLLTLRFIRAGHNLYTINNSDTGTSRLKAYYNKARQLIHHSFPLVQQRFLFTAMLCFLAHTVVWNPVIGFPADWDLFSFFSIPANLLAVYLLFPVTANPDVSVKPVTYKPSNKIYRDRMAGILLLAVIPGLSWVYNNSRLTAKSANHLAQSRANIQKFRAIVEEEGIFVQLKDHNRKKKFIEARLFTIRAEAMIRELPESRQKQLSKELEDATVEFLEIQTLPDPQYQERMEESWQRLARLNARLHRMTGRK